MKLDYLEIGTCDFSMECDKQNKVGYSIEPVKYYYDKLPSNENKHKLRLAISDKIGFCYIYSLPEKIIKEYHLPLWLKGCSCINKYHPTVVKILLKHNLPLELILKEKVEMTTLNNLLVKLKITELDLLKIDCEGHDYYILKEYFNNPHLLPKFIYFENNKLTPIEIKKKINLLIDQIPYEIIKATCNNIKLKLMTS